MLRMSPESLDSDRSDQLVATDVQVRETPDEEDDDEDERDDNEENKNDEEDDKDGYSE
jgi:hypothetical protein